MKRFGFWVVQTVWLAGDTWTSAWTDSNKTFSIGCKATGGPLVGFSSGVEYSDASSGSGWKHPIPTVKV